MYKNFVQRYIFKLKMKSEKFVILWENDYLFLRK